MYTCEQCLANTELAYIDQNRLYCLQCFYAQARQNRAAMDTTLINNTINEMVDCGDPDCVTCNETIPNRNAPLNGTIPANALVCTCDIVLLMKAGCQCGGR